MQEFVTVTDEEWQQVKDQMPSHVAKRGVLRCTDENCRQVQQRNNHNVRGKLPEPDSE